jgi:hypothetical protein
MWVRLQQHETRHGKRTRVRCKKFFAGVYTVSDVMFECARQSLGGKPKTLTAGRVIKTYERRAFAGLSASHRIAE